ncbi:MAG: 4-hydroxybenzoate octaprenyltransferase [Betaproteobacteria bacterium]|nr:4-hydroxybenzoate octaprenyltransferase [Betaproteobacteria bacterium]
MNFQAIVKRLDAYERLVRLDKPIGSLLLLWPTLWAVWLASAGWPRWEFLLIFVLGTLTMRSAGCAVNDFADRDFDAQVERTKHRPLAAGEIGPREALAVGAFFALLAFLLVLFLNRLAILLSVAALAIAIVYPFAKRFFALPQAWLGIAFSFGVPMAYAAVAGELPLECWWLMAGTFFWIMAYDTEYAMVDRDDDVKIGIHTSAILFGRHDVTAVMACYAVMLVLLGTLGARLSLEWPFYAGLAVAAILMGYHWRLIRGRSRENCFRAFMHNNWVGAAILLGIVLSFPLPPAWR